MRGLAWLAEQKTPVINISLVGPPNLLLAAAVQALVPAPTNSSSLPGGAIGSRGLASASATASGTDESSPSVAPP